MWKTDLQNLSEKNSFSFFKVDIKESIKKGGWHAIFLSWKAIEQYN